MTVSFGYSTGTGSATNWGEGHDGSRFQNTTGGDVYVTQIDLLNVSTARTNTHQCAIYTDVEGVPHTLIGVTDILSSVALGTNTFTVSGPAINVVDGAYVWLMIRHSGNLSCTGMNSSEGVNTQPTNGGTAFPSFYKDVGAITSGKVMTLVATGDATAPGTSDLVTGYLLTEPLSEGDASVSSGYLLTEPLSEGDPNVRANYLMTEPMSEGYPKIKSSYLMIESLHPVPPELPMSTDTFPGFGSTVVEPFSSPLPGLAFSVHKKPLFKTNIKESASGVEVRTSLTEYPRWDFELSYEFLEDRTGADSSLKTIVGFFLSRNGSYDSFLFKDPDDYIADYGLCGASDGVTTEFPLRRTYGGFHEKVGQLDDDLPLVVYHEITESTTIPASPGPYTVTVVNAADFYRDAGVVKGGTAMVKVSGSPAAGQYSVNETTGVYTFNATDHDDAIDISYSYEVDNTDYEVTMPNLIVFDSAPSEGQIYASFQFFFACRFVEDQQDFEKFADQLWSLQECNFRSIIQ